MIRKLLRLWFGKPRIEDAFVPWHAKKKERKYHLSGDYELVITPYKSYKHTSGVMCCDFTLGEVFKWHFMGDGTYKEKIVEIQRSYHSFWFEWVLGHPDGHDYLLCGKSTESISVIQLDTGEYQDFYTGFCWAHVDPSPDKTTLAVHGCYWAAPFELKIYDFSKPIKLLEPVDNDRLDPIDDDELYGAVELLGWNKDSSCRIGRIYDIRKTDGKPYYLLTEEEQEEVEDNWRELLSYKQDEIIWKR